MQIEPLSIVAGDTIEWTREGESCRFIDIDGNSTWGSSTEWSLNYYFAGEHGAFQAAATSTGNDFEISLAATVTAGYSTGLYFWSAILTHTTLAVLKRHTIDSGRLDVVSNMKSQQAGYDGRSHVKKVLDAIEAVIEGRATKDQSSMTIGGRTLSRIPVPELLLFRAQYQAEYNAEISSEKINKGLNSGRKIVTRF